MFIYKFDQEYYLCIKMFANDSVVQLQASD